MNRLGFLLRAPLSAWIGMAVIAFFAVAAAFAPWIATHGETQIVGDVWEPWSWATLLGTDHIGRDMYTRLVFGARNTISIALLITVGSFALGIVLGFLSAVIGGWVDQVISRIVDILMSIPILIFALFVLSVLGTSIPVLIVVIAVLDSTRVFRVSRAIAMDIVVMDYVEIARLRGEKVWWIMRREILPNALTPLTAEFGLRFCFVFLFISSLSFLGLGIQPPAADWGSMVRENSGAITFGILTPLWPALSIAVLTIGVNLVVDWVQRNASGMREQG